jgi:hypothetical protein
MKSSHSTKARSAGLSNNDSSQAKPPDTADPGSDERAVASTLDDPPPLLVFTPYVSRFNVGYHDASIYVSAHTSLRAAVRCVARTLSDSGWIDKLLLKTTTVSKRLNANLSPAYNVRILGTP